jgi:hypothetical protein
MRTALRYPPARPTIAPWVLAGLCAAALLIICAFAAHG